MARGEVEGFEVVPLGLDLGPQLDLVSERLEHRFDLAPDLGEDVNVSATQRRTWKGDVDGLCFGEVRDARRLELRSPRGEGGLDRPLGLVDCLAERALLVRAQLADALEQLAHAPALASEVFDLDMLELLWRLGLADGRQRFAGQSGRIAHTDS